MKPWMKPLLSMLIAVATGAACFYAMSIHDAKIAGAGGWASGVWLMSSLVELGEYYDLKLKVAKVAAGILDEAEKKGLL